MTDIAGDKLVIIGRFGKPYGVRGWLHLSSYTSPETDILAYRNLYFGMGKSFVPLPDIEYKVTRHGIIVKLPSVDTPEAAKSYTNLEIAVLRSALPKLNEGEYYWTDLEGMEVIGANGASFGTVRFLFVAGENDVLVVNNDKKEMFIPYLKDVILKVDSAARKIFVDWDDE